LDLKLNIIIGSTRPGRAGPVIAQWLREAAVRHGKFAVELVDLADFDLPLLDEAAHPAKRQYTNEPTKRWSASVASADAFVFVTPEYDYFAPAALVNAVQVLLHEWVRKPAGIVSYGGLSGGLRSAQVLRQLLGNVNVHAVPQVVPVPHFQKLVDNGAFHPGEQFQAGVNDMLNEVHLWACALRSLRTGEAATSPVRSAAA
jgi:NAD(P)H-dependent FMN reductase